MASTTEGGNPVHKMKRTGRALWVKKSSIGVPPPSSSSVGDRMRSQTTAQGNQDDALPPRIVSDIPAASHSNGPPIQTPVPLPVPMRSTNSTTSTTSTTSTPAPAVNRKPMAANEDILQAQRDWEKKQTMMEEQGPEQEARTSKPPLRPQTYVDLTKTPTESTETFGQSPQRPSTSTSDDMAGLNRLPEEDLLQQMTELNRPASAGARRRETRTQTALSTSAATYVSPYVEELPFDPGDAMDTGDGESSPSGLQYNADNRSYYTYIEDDGSEQSTNKAPIPPGKERYDEGENGAKRPFVCPVRDCRVLSLTMKVLSSHFHGKHNRSLFNDNGDGTFSKIGDYLNEEGSSPGIIVSCNPLSPGAPPPAVADYSESQKKLLNKKSPPITRAGVAGSAPPDTSKRSLRGDSGNDSIEERIPKRPKTTPVPLPVQPSAVLSSPMLQPATPPPPPPPPPPQTFEPPMTDVLRYLHRSLPSNQQVPARVDILALSKYEQVRVLPGSWWEHHHDKILDPLQYACILAYLVGKVEEMNPCRRWKGLSRLCEPCVGLPPDLPAEARAAFSKTETCITCQYQFCCYRTKNECEWASKDHNEDVDVTTEEAAAQQNGHSAVGDIYKTVVLDDVDAGSNVANKVDDHSALPQVTRQNGLFSSTKQSEQYPMQSTEKKSPELETTAQPTSTPTQKPSRAEVTEMEEMEDWEVAPGTMKDKKTDTNVGFSNAYMSNQHPITISSGLSFNVLILKPGHTHHWPIEANKVRTCSLATGKISVKMGNDQPFKLGPNGLVVIRSGQNCMVANRLYSDAILHCTTFEEDF